MVIADPNIAVQRADMEKMLDVVKAAVKYHKAKDQMNAATHMTPARFSPLTTNLDLTAQRMAALLEGLREEETIANADADDTGGTDPNA